MKQLREIQADRRAREKEDLEKLTYLAMDYQGRGASRQTIDNIDPTELGFVCSQHAWRLYRRRNLLPAELPEMQKAA